MKWTTSGNRLHLIFFSAWRHWGRIQEVDLFFVLVQFQLHLASITKHWYLLLPQSQSLENVLTEILSNITTALNKWTNCFLCSSVFSRCGQLGAKSLLHQAFLGVNPLNKKSNTNPSNCKFSELSVFGQTQTQQLSYYQETTGNNECGLSQATAALSFPRKSLIKGCFVTFLTFFDWWL